LSKQELLKDYLIFLQRSLIPRTLQLWEKIVMKMLL